MQDVVILAIPALTAAMFIILTAEINMKNFFLKLWAPRNIAGLNLFVTGFCLALAVASALRGDLGGVAIDLFLALLNLFSYINLKRLDK